MRDELSNAKDAARAQERAAKAAQEQVASHAAALERAESELRDCVSRITEVLLQALVWCVVRPNCYSSHHTRAHHPQASHKNDGLRQDLEAERTRHADVESKLSTDYTSLKVHMATDRYQVVTPAD